MWTSKVKSEVTRLAMAWQSPWSVSSSPSIVCNHCSSIFYPAVRPGPVPERHLLLLLERPFAQSQPPRWMLLHEDDIGHGIVFDSHAIGEWVVNEYFLAAARSVRLAGANRSPEGHLI